MQLNERTRKRRRRCDETGTVYTRRSCRMSSSFRMLTLPILFVTIACGITTTHGGSGAGCEFPMHWSGKWFQSGVGLLQINRTSIEKKGECYESSGDKFVIHDRSDDCYRCMAIHEKHRSVLQYKETFCDQKAPLSEMCYSITGDAALYSMFRKQTDGDNSITNVVSCPFKQAPFTFTYNRGSGDCSNPPSRAESCTDDSRLVLKYQACPDIQSTESNIEELVCVATWKEGSTRYLVGRISQSGRRGALASDEDQYRCFVYERVSHHNTGRVTYHVAQSGDATCNGLQSALEGSRTMKLTTVDNQHGRCRFPSWITDHHTWLSLDHRSIYKFSLRNATLRITTQPTTDDTTNTNEHNDNVNGAGETRVVCHSILSSDPQKRVQIVAHVTAGCDSGYICMVFYRRDASVIEIQQSQSTFENTDDACRYFDPATTPFTTLIIPSLHPKRCPQLGRYTVIGNKPVVTGERRKRRQNTQNYEHQDTPADLMAGGGPSDPGTVPAHGPPECLSHDYEALSVGCSEKHETLEFRSSSCLHQPVTAYMCHGGWEDNDTYYLIASPVARKSTDALRYCLVYQFVGGASSTDSGNHRTGDRQSGTRSLQQGHGSNGPWDYQGKMMRLSAVAGSCHRHITPGTSGVFAFNFTTNGTCAEKGGINSGVTLYAVPLLTTTMIVILLLTSR